MDTAILVFTGYLAIAAILGLLLVTLPRWLAPHRPGELKGRTYECGEQPIGEPWVRFKAGYYIFALVFVIFDVESAFMYPWAVIMRRLGVAGLVEMGLFVGILLLGLAYAWRKGVLKWV